MVAAIAEAVIGPKPGMLISRRAVSSFCASFAQRGSSPSQCRGNWPHVPFAWLGNMRRPHWLTYRRARIGPCATLSDRGEAAIHDLFRARHDRTGNLLAPSQRASASNQVVEKLMPKS
jgi:hypothetical protein